MNTLMPRAALQAIQRIGQALDPFFAGRWYWSMKRWIAERQLQHALEQHGDQSMQVRQATERYRRADFAVRYWRSAPGPVMRIAEQALDAGVPMHAIRLLVLNTDLRIRGGQVYLRRPFIVTVLNIVFVRPKYALDVMRDFRASLKTVRIPKLLKPKQFNSSSAYSAPKSAKFHKLS